MQGIMETIFDILYLCGVLAAGIFMLLRAGDSRQHRLFGLMAVILGCGDAFHLIPRSWALLHEGLDAYVPALGIGKLVTSITMTVFYVLLYGVWRLRYRKRARSLDAAVGILAAVRVALCCFPQNGWLSPHAPVRWGILRNLPFAALGILIIVLFYREARRNADKAFRFMWLAVTLSFGFYIPVVLFSQTVPLTGILMIPKTVCYVWIVWMGLRDLQRKQTEASW